MTSDRTAGSVKTLRLARRVAIVLILTLHGPLLAQDQVRDITQPLVTLRTEGHNAPVRSLVFADPKGTRLLSAGRDKVINDWKLDAAGISAELIRTIRPPVWRGPRGELNAIALSPWAAVEGQQILAAAGHGIENSRGNIVLYRYPGLEEMATGQVIGHLTGGDIQDVAAGVTPTIRGHGDSVTCLAFDPRGRFLVSGSLDRTVRVWVVDGLKPGVAPNLRPSATFRLQAPAMAIAFRADGQRLFVATGSGQGSVLVYNTEQYTDGQAPMGTIGLGAGGVPINSMSVSKDGRWVVVGREDGVLARIDMAASPAAPTLLNNPKQEKTGAIEAVALSPNVRQLAVSYVTHGIGPASELPRTECRVEVMDLFDGNIPRVRLVDLPNFSYSLAFTPDGGRLVVAGGDTQKFYLFDMKGPIRLTADWAGKGRSVRDVGFTADGASLAISRKPRASLLADDFYEAFHLEDRAQARLLPSAVVHRDVTECQGWTVRPLGTLELELVSKTKATAIRIPLDPNDLRWWSYSFIPPDTARKLRTRPLLAVGTDSAITLYDVETGRKIRVFTGHIGPIYALAPSPDGKFLASGSGDQTVRLWSLVNADRPPRLGAAFEQAPDGRLVVKKVDNQSPAEAMGLVAGDEITDVWVRAQKISKIDLIRQADALAPDAPLRVQIRRHFDLFDWEIFGKDAVFQIGTTPRDGPALTFFLSTGGDWAIWSPRGYYDASAAGDLDFLGWHLNNQRSLFQPRPTEFRRMSDFAAKFRQPRGMPGGRIDRILSGGDPVAVFRDDLPRDEPQNLVLSANRVVTIFQKPRPGDVVLNGIKPLNPIKPGRYLADGGRPTIQLASQLPEGAKVLFGNNSQVFGPFDRTNVGADGLVDVAFALDPGPNRVTHTVVGGDGITHTDVLNIDGVPSFGEPAPEGTLWMKFLAPAFLNREVPEFRFAATDATDLAAFFPEHLVTRKGRPFRKPVRLPDADADPESIRRDLSSLAAMKFGRDDLLVLVIETHMLKPSDDRGPALTTAETRYAGKFAGPVVEMADLDDAIRTAAGKCAVLVFVDAQSDKTPPAMAANVDAWARQVRSRYGVSVLSASNNSPSQFNDRRRNFTEEILKMPKIHSFLARRPDGLFTLEEFGTQLVLKTRIETRGVQQAQFYRAETADPKRPLFARTRLMADAGAADNLRASR